MGTQHDPVGSKCPDCKGDGSFALLVSIQVCSRCQGAGRVEPPAAPDQIVPPPLTIVQTPTGYKGFDAQGRLVLEVCTGGNVISMTYE